MSPHIARDREGARACRSIEIAFSAALLRAFDRYRTTFGSASRRSVRARISHRHHRAARACGLARVNEGDAASRLAFHDLRRGVDAAPGGSVERRQRLLPFSNMLVGG
jgi:hypothetical protein